MNSVGWLTFATLVLVVMLGPARWAMLGLLGGVLYMTQGQGIEVLGLNIYPSRALALVAFLRVLLRGEWSELRLNGIDKLLVLAYAYQAVVYTLNENGSAKNMTGLVIDTALAYFSCRCLVRSLDDLDWLLARLAYLLAPYVLLLYVESSTGANPFAVIGGIANPSLRSGRPRAIGSFGHASILGTFGASFLPLYIAMAYQGRRKLGLVGVGLCLAIVALSNSGGPLTCAMLGIAGWLLWPLRTQMSTVRLAALVGLVLLGLFMEAPLWYLPAKMSDLTGGDGWHRSYLMEVSFLHFNQWALLGMPAGLTGDWFPYTLASGQADIINYYVAFGISAGLPAMGLLVLLLIGAYCRLGQALTIAREDARTGSRLEVWGWGLGVVLAIHIFNWFGLVYFDQYYAVFLMQLALLSTVSDIALNQPMTEVEALDPTH